jgi:hypothetical protein
MKEIILRVFLKYIIEILDELIEEKKLNYTDKNNILGKIGL